jgi:hypothetical protein
MLITLTKTNMSQPSTAPAAAPEGGDNGAPKAELRVIQGGREATGEVLNADFTGQLNALLEEVTALPDESLTLKEAKGYKKRARVILDQAETSRIITLNPTAQDRNSLIQIVTGHKTEGEAIIAAFNTVCDMADFKQRVAPEPEKPAPKTHVADKPAPAAPKQQEREPRHHEERKGKRETERGAKEDSPLYIEIEDITIGAKKHRINKRFADRAAFEAFTGHQNPEDAAILLETYNRLVTERLGRIDDKIAEALPEIAKVTIGKGVMDIMAFFVDRGLVKRNADGSPDGAYSLKYPNDPDLQKTKAADLVEAANAKIKELETKSAESHRQPERESGSSPHEGKRNTEQRSIVYPLAIEYEGRIFNTYAKAVNHSRTLGKNGPAFLKTFEGIFDIKVEEVTQSIENATREIENAKRIVTKGDQKGVVEIMEPFVEMGLFIHEGNSFFPNLDVEDAAKKVLKASVNKLADAVSAKMREITSAIKAKEAAYEAIVKSDGGDERIVMDESGKKELARYAYQIHIEEKRGTTLIVVDKVEVKHTSSGAKLLRAGQEFVYPDKEKRDRDTETPWFLIKAADKLLRKAEK